jgi:stalled ribosome alternative rescue factor ArfA
MRNIVAKDLRTNKYRQRIIRAKKGKGSYNRNILKRNFGGKND